MNSGIFGWKPFDVDIDNGMPKPLLGLPQVVPVPYHIPKSYDWMLGNSDGSSNRDIVIVVDTILTGSKTVSLTIGGPNNGFGSVDWGDGSSGGVIPLGIGNVRRVGSYETRFEYFGGTIFSLSHTYANHGQYTIILKGIYSTSVAGGTMPKSTSIVSYLSFGNLETTGPIMVLNLSSLSNLTYVPPYINNGITNLTTCFQNCTRFNHPNVNYWDVSNVFNLNLTFAGATSFNQDLDNWGGKLGNVTNFQNAFNGATSFDGSVSGWNLTASNSCFQMFANCSRFTGKGLNSWNTSGVTNTATMFSNCINLGVGISGGLDLSSWNMSNVTDRYRMFIGVNNSTFVNLSNWKMKGRIGAMMYGVAAAKTYSVSGWEFLPGIGDSQYLLGTSSTFGHTPVGYSTWSGMNNLTNLSNCFYFVNVTESLASWDVSNVTNFQDMFTSNVGTANFNLAFQEGSGNSLSGWNTSSATNMRGMFQATFSSSNFNGDISNWNVSNVTNMSIMFRGARNFNRNLGNWNVGKVATMAGMFTCDSNVGAYGNMAFDGAGLSNWSVTGCSDFSTMFANSGPLRSGISNWSIQSGANLTSMFESSKIVSGYFSNWTFNGNGINCTSMFNNSRTFTGSGLSSWNTSGISNMFNMFNSCTSFNEDIGNWNTSNVTNMYNVFSNSNVGGGGTIFNRDLSLWNTSKVGTMRGMFDYCYAFNNGGNTNLNWDVSSVGDFAFTFRNCSNMNINFSGWNTASATTFNAMFQGCTSFKGSGIESFKLATLNSSDSLTNFAAGCTFPSGQYDLILNTWNTNKSSGVNGVANWRTDLSPHFGNSKYTAAGSGARAALISYGWTITDGGLQT